MRLAPGRSLSPLCPCYFSPAGHSSWFSTVLECWASLYLWFCGSWPISDTSASVRALVCQCVWCPSLGSICISPLGGRVMFRDLLLITDDFTLRCYDGVIIFNYWMPYKPSGECKSFLWFISWYPLVAWSYCFTYHTMKCKIHSLV